MRWFSSIFDFNVKRSMQCFRQFFIFKTRKPALVERTYVCSIFLGQECLNHHFPNTMQQQAEIFMRTELNAKKIRQKNTFAIHHFTKEVSEISKFLATNTIFF